MERAQKITDTPLLGTDVSSLEVARWGGLQRLLNKPLISYYAILGITTSLIVISILLAISIYSVQRVDHDIAPKLLLQHQLIAVALGLVCMWITSRSSPRLFRALAYPLLAVAIVGLALTLVRGVDGGQNSGSRWIELGGQHIQPSEIAKPALAIWGADLLARKAKLGQLADWRHMLVPLMPGTGLLCLLVMTGNDFGTTFILLVVFLALLWVVGLPRQVFSGIVILMVLAAGLMIVSSSYRYNQVMVFLHLQSGPDMQAIQVRRAFGAGDWFGAGLKPSNQKWGSVPNITGNFIFVILGEDLGLLVAMCTVVLYGGLAYVGMRIARSVNDYFIRLAATAITAWIAVQAFVNIAGVLGFFPGSDMLLPLISYSPLPLLTTMIALGILMSFARHEPLAIRAISTKTGHFRRTVNWLWRGRLSS